MVWHIFKKDFRLLWHFAAGVAVLQWLGMIMIFQAHRDSSAITNLLDLAIMGQILASGILVATAVQLDSIPGVRQDWLIRPIERRDLLLAKLVFILAMVQLPILIGDVIEARVFGFSFGQAFGAALVRSLCLLAVFYIPVAAFASITRNLMEGIVALVVVGVVVSALSQIVNGVAPWYWRMTGWSGVDWVVEDGMLLIAILGASAILLLQYFRRQTWTSRWLTVSAALLVFLVNFIPWKSAFAVQQHFSRQPGAASSLSLQFDPSIGKHADPARKGAGGYHYYWTRHEEPEIVYLPLRIQGLPSGTMLRGDMVKSRLIGPGGKSEDLAESGSIPLVTGDTAHQLLIMRASLFNKLRDTPVRLEIDYSLTLLQYEGAHAMPALNGRQTIPELGICDTTLSRSGVDVQLHCLKAGVTPPCATFFLENAPSGRRNPQVKHCDGEYAPFLVHYEPDGLRRTNWNFPFMDESGLWHMPVDASQLQNSQLVMRFYQPIDHFTRRLEIPNVRLGDWLPTKGQ